MSAAATLDFFQNVSPNDTLPAEVDVEQNDNADGCGALGCRSTSPLYSVAVNGLGIRILCYQHVREYLCEKAEVDENRLPGWLG